MSGKDLSTMTAQPIELEFGGRKIKFSRLSLDDFAALEMYLKQGKAQAIAETLKAIGEDRAYITKIIEETLKEQLGEEEWRAGMENPDGQAFLVWRSARRAQPRLTKDDLWGMIPMDELKRLVKIITGVDADDPKNKPGTTEAAKEEAPPATKATTGI